ncbi:MAG: hypothetical protein HY721_29440 [Planctomycetes bacterium]|nr:hypothetical protein [Planctomycetota bacterium]
MSRRLAILPCFVFASLPALAQDPEEEKPEGPEEKPKDEGRPGNFEGYDAYFEIRDVKYVRPKGSADPQTIELKVNVSPHVPRGTKIHLGLELFGLPVEETDYVLKDENRTDLPFTWKLTKRIATGEYMVRTHIHLDKQTPAVQRLIKQNAKVFPPKSEPWSWYAKPPIKVGSKDEEAQEASALCEAYTELMDKLIEHLGQLLEKLEAAKKGEELVKDGTLDKDAFEKYVLEWRKGQAAIQKEIRALPIKQEALFLKSQSAFANLQELGKMVAKRGVQEQKVVSDKYKVAFYNPGVQDFGGRYQYKCDKEALNKKYQNIRTLVGCPEEPAEGEGDPGASPDSPGGEGAKAEEGAKPDEAAKPEEAKPDEAKPEDAKPEGEGDRGGSPNAPPPEEPKPDEGKAGKKSPGKKGADKKAPKKK